MESCENVLKRGRNGQNLDVQEWLQKNFEEVKVRSTVKKAKEIYVLWLESGRNKKIMMEERQRNIRWRQFYIEEWMCTE